LVGTRLIAERLAGAGSIKVELNNIDPEARVKHIEAMLVGEDGSAIGFSDLHTPEQVPVNRYAVESVSCDLVMAGQRWSFTFSHRGDRVWHDVEDGKTVSLDLLRQFDFGIRHKASEEGLELGQSLAVRPWLTTEDGLEITSCSICDAKQTKRRSYFYPSHCAQLYLETVGADRQKVASESSGFA
jgi:hypothetical protein